MKPYKFSVLHLVTAWEETIFTVESDSQENAVETANKYYESYYNPEIPRQLNEEELNKLNINIDSSELNYSTITPVYVEENDGITTKELHIVDANGKLGLLEMNGATPFMGEENI